MGKVLCAIRGGEASYRTQDAAIALAKERGDQLLFLYVVDIAFISKTARAVRPDVVRAEMDRMGEFLLDLAQERARSQGISPELILRSGDLRQELKAATRELGVDVVVLGRPGGEASAFSPEELQAFADEIEAETQARVQILSTG
jgi:nucleotide-binding universal stress UspA family protein